MCSVHIKMKLSPEKNTGCAYVNHSVTRGWFVTNVEEQHLLIFSFLLPEVERCRSGFLESHLSVCVMKSATEETTIRRLSIFYC